MSKKGFAVKQIEAYKAKSKVYTILTGDGFGLKVLPTGSKKFILRYYINNHRRELTIGTFPLISLKEAEGESYKFRKLVEKGEDPLLIRKQQLKAPTLKQLADDFIERHSKVKKKTWKEDQRRLNKHLLSSTLKNTKAQDIKRADLKRLLDGIARNNGKVEANRTFAVTSKMFKWAVENEILEYTPCYGVTKPGGKETSKDRYLDEKEIKVFLQSLNNPSTDHNTKRALKLILFTGARPGEVCGMHHSEIHGDWWILPAERTKNSIEHKIYLTSTTKDLIGTGTGYVMESKRTNKPITPRSLSEYLLRRFSQKKESKHTPKNPHSRTAPKNLETRKFTPHDLRRTCGTHIRSLGFTEEVVKNILNHTNQSITAIYNRYSYDKEKQQALEAWSNRINQIITDQPNENVVQLYPQTTSGYNTR